MAYMRTNAGRIELIDRLEEYERQHQLAPIVDEPSRNFVRENLEVEYPDETKRRIADARRATIARREQAVITKNEREQQEITRRNMASHEYKQVAQRRNEELAKCVSRLNRSQGSALSEMVGIVHHGLVDTETKRSLGAGSEKTRELEKDAGCAPDHPLFT